MTTEPAVGALVAFRYAGARRVGEVREVLTAGKVGGVGVWRRRRRARVRYVDAADGHAWETFVDLELLTPAPPAARQAPLF
jgi:hypothetical protein